MQVVFVVPFVCTELSVTVEDVLPVAVALPLDDELCVTWPTVGEPLPNPTKANSARRMNSSAM